MGHLGNYLIQTYQSIPSGQRCRLIRFSQNINQAISSKFSVHNLGQLIYRTRLKIVAGMLRLTDYGDFAEYLGSQWNYYLRNAIAWIPMPFVPVLVAAKLLKPLGDLPPNTVKFFSAMEVRNRPEIGHGCEGHQCAESTLATEKCHQT